MKIIIVLFVVLCSSISSFAQVENDSDATESTNVEVTTSHQNEEKTETLQYISFKLQNNSIKRLHAYVRGPKGKRFSYGFPLNPFQKRAENWPVGSKVFLGNSHLGKKAIYTVKAEDAGKVVKLF